MSQIKSNIIQTAENYFDNTVLETTDTIFQEILKAFPIASSGLAIYQVFRNYNEKQKLKNILEFIKEGSVHDKFHRTLILSGFCFLKIAKISLNSSFFPKPIKR